MTLCIDAPADGATATGDVPVAVSYTVNGTGPTAQRMQFTLDGQYLMTDYQSPYTFLLPTEKFVDGPHTLSVQAWMRDQNLSDFTNISLNFSNGNATGGVPTITGDASTCPSVWKLHIGLPSFGFRPYTFLSRLAATTTSGVAAADA